VFDVCAILEPADQTVPSKNARLDLTFCWGKETISAATVLDEAYVTTVLASANASRDTSALNVRARPSFLRIS
jgi:hypothetical protein